MTTIDFPEWVKRGAMYEYDFGPVYGRNNCNQGRRFEIRAFVDARAVVREWHPKSNHWTYTAEGRGHFIALGDFRIIRDQGAAK